MKKCSHNKAFPNQEKRQADFDCSIGFAMNVIGSKWRAIILWHILKGDSIRYGQLKSHIPNISHKVFAQELKKLEADGLITRTVHPTVPPTVEYGMTERGQSLEKILTELCHWGNQYVQRGQP